MVPDAHKFGSIFYDFYRIPRKEERRKERGRDTGSAMEPFCGEISPLRTATNRTSNQIQMVLSERPSQGAVGVVGAYGCVWRV